MRLAWATDIHLNFLRTHEVAAFARRLSDSGADAVLLGGDIAEAPTLEAHLEALELQIACPIYFVLGNHDFYRCSIRDVRARAAGLVRRRPRLRWLSDAGVVPLRADTALIGHDGWGDGRVGDYLGSRVFLNDYVLIEELAGIDSLQGSQLLSITGNDSSFMWSNTSRHSLPVSSRKRMIAIDGSRPSLASQENLEVVVRRIHLQVHLCKIVATVSMISASATEAPRQT